MQENERERKRKSKKLKGLNILISIQIVFSSLVACIQLRGLMVQSVVHLQETRTFAVSSRN